jgi:SWI/SNF-related matrix-associated actin-dependent regulator 1 of chromatin subfamily A
MGDQILNNSDKINVVVTTYDMAAKKEDNKFMKKLKPDVSVCAASFSDYVNQK